MISFKHNVVFCISNINPMAIGYSIWCLASRRAVNFGTKIVIFYFEMCRRIGQMLDGLAS